MKWVSLANYSVAYEETRSNRASDFRDFVCFQRQSFFTFILLYCSWCCACGGRKKSSVHHHSAGYIFFFWGHWAYPGYFENRIPLRVTYAASQTTALHMKRLNQAESPIFVILCVLCFQWQSFLIFILHLPRHLFQNLFLFKLFYLSVHATINIIYIVSKTMSN